MYIFFIALLFFSLLISCSKEEEFSSRRQRSATSSMINAKGEDTTKTNPVQGNNAKPEEFVDKNNQPIANVPFDPNKPAVMCAAIQSSEKKDVGSFCAQGGLGATCIGMKVHCQNDASTTLRRDGQSGLSKFNWYQAAVFWARQNNHPYVILSPGKIEVNQKSQIIAGGRGTGLLIPSNIKLSGSTDLKNPTVFIQTDKNPNPGVNPPANRMFAIITVSEDMYVNPQKDIGSTLQRTSVDNVHISYIRVSGVNDVPSTCSTFSYEMKQIEDTHNQSIPKPKVYPRSEIQAYWGIWIDQAISQKEPVSVDHVVLAHLENAITFGWASYGMNGNASCKPNSCVRLSYGNPVGTTCSVGNFARLDVLKTNKCIIESIAPNCTINHCKMAKFEYTASESKRGYFKNSSICDVDTGISASYASNLDIKNNLILAILPTANNNTNAGIWTYRHTDVKHNYITDGDYSVAAEGSIFPYFDVETWKKATGWSPYDPGISAVDYQVLGQYITVEANKFFLKHDPYGEYGEHVKFEKNRLLTFTHSGVTLVRQKNIWAGENQITGRGPNASHSGVQMLDVIGSSIYGNNISAIGSGIWVYGSPGVNSVVGSTNNTCHQKYNLANNTFTNFPNNFSQYTRIWEIGPSASCNH